MGRAANEQGQIRRLSAFDHEEYTRHLLRLDEATRYLRFCMIASDQFLIDYAQGCSRWDVVIYGFFIDGVMHGAAELRPVCPGTGTPSGRPTQTAIVVLRSNPAAQASR